MKRLLKKLIFGFFDLYFKNQFMRCIKNADLSEKVYLIDIDNTLADTWPSLKNYVYRNENQRYRSLSIFMGMRNFILDKTNRKSKVIFISARSYLNYYSTLKWLSANELHADEVILVYKAEDKLWYINELLKREMLVVYIDDLSYGHESGDMKLYEKMILNLSQLPVEYLGVKEIELINSTYEVNNKGIEKNIPDYQNYISY